MTRGDNFFLFVYILAPVVLLGLLYYRKTFPLSLAIATFFLGPFAGTFVMVAIGEFAKPAPMPSIIPGAVLFFYIIYGLPIFGFWIALCSASAWHLARLSRLNVLVENGKKFGIGVIAGAGVGVILIFAFFAVFSLNPDWPIPDKLWNAIRDPVSLLSLTLQGAIAGAVCGSIVAAYSGPVASRGVQIIDPEL